MCLSAKSRDCYEQPLSTLRLDFYLLNFAARGAPHMTSDYLIWKPVEAGLKAHLNTTLRSIRNQRIYGRLFTMVDPLPDGIILQSGRAADFSVYRPRPSEHSTAQV